MLLQAVEVSRIWGLQHLVWCHPHVTCLGQPGLEQSCEQRRHIARSGWKDPWTQVKKRTLRDRKRLFLWSWHYSTWCSTCFQFLSLILDKNVIFFHSCQREGELTLFGLYCWVVLALAPWLWWWLTPGAFLTPGALHTSCVYPAGEEKAVVCFVLSSLCLWPGLYGLSCVSAVQQPEVTVSVGWRVRGDSVSPSRCDTNPLVGLAVVCSLRALWNRKSWNRWDSKICFMKWLLW